MNEDSAAGPVMLAKRIVNRIGRPFGVNPFPRAFSDLTTAAIVDRANVFDAIYRSNFGGSGESRSGVWSEVEFSQAYRARLRALIAQHRLKRLFDVPCGEINRSIALTRDAGVTYVGGDISASQIAEVRQQRPEVELRIFDTCIDRFPDADVWHCRHCLSHLTFADIRRAFKNFIQLSIPFALLTTDRARWLHRHLDVSLGGFRFDLERPPIGLTQAEGYLPDHRKGSDFPRYVGLRSRAAIAETLVCGKFATA